MSERSDYSYRDQNPSPSRVAFQVPPYGPPVENPCAKCGERIAYPDGVYLKSGREVHAACVRGAS